MHALTDKQLTNATKNLKARLDEITKAYSLFDDPARVLQFRDTKTIIKLVEKLKTELYKAVKTDALFNAHLRKISIETIADNLDTLEEYISKTKLTLNTSKNDIKNLVTRVVEMQSENTAAFVAAIADRMFEKTSLFRHLASSKLREFAKKQTETLAAVVRRTIQRDGKFLSDGETSVKNQLKAYWKNLTDKYGGVETVQYADGKNFPLNSYVDMRGRTSSAEVSRISTEMLAIENDIYTGKISSHRATDTCNKWEGKIIFYNEILRAEFLRMYPDYKEARGWPTKQEVEQDDTHMFKPNCRHTITPYPIHLIEGLTPAPRKQIDGAA